MNRTTEPIRIGPLEIRFLLEGAATAGSLAMFEFDVPANARVPIAHRHDAYEETIYGVKGVLAWTVEGKVHNVGPGEVLCIPRGAVHRFDNTSGADATWGELLAAHAKIDAIDLYDRNPTSGDKELDVDEAWIRFGRETESQRCEADHHERAWRVGEVGCGAQRAVVGGHRVERRHLAHERPEVGHVRGEIAAGRRGVARGRVGRHATLPPALERQPFHGRRRVRVAGRVEIGPDEARAAPLGWVRRRAAIDPRRDMLPPACQSMPQPRGPVSGPPRRPSPRRRRRVGADGCRRLIPGPAQGG